MKYQFTVRQEKIRFQFEKLHLKTGEKKTLIPLIDIDLRLRVKFFQ